MLSLPQRFRANAILKVNQWIGRSVNRKSSELMTTSEKQSGMDVAQRKRGSVKFRLGNSSDASLAESACRFERSETFRMMSKRNFTRVASVRLDFLFHFLIKQKVKDG
jgi:hypothetical protein